jgi:ABC-type histidine transport system ATPase subunit
MEWPAGLIQKMSYADTIESTLLKFLKDGRVPEEGTPEHLIVERWMKHRYG